MAFKLVTQGPPVGRASTAGRKPMKFLEGEFVNTFLAYLEEGMGFKAACDLCGVGSTSVRKYIREGLQDLDAGRESRLADFAYQATAAMAEAKRTRIAQLHNAASNPAFWGAAGWWLERHAPQEYGRQDRLSMQINGAVNLSEKLEKIGLTDQEAETIGAILGRIDGLRDESDSRAPESLGLGDSGEPEWDR